MDMGKERFCKCGHSKNEHYKQPKTKLSIITECQKCKCSDYMNRNTSGKISSIYGITLSILIGLAIIIIGIPLLSVTDTIKIPVSVLGIILILVLSLGILQLTPSISLSYFEHKRRKEYPIEDET